MSSNRLQFKALLRKVLLPLYKPSRSELLPTFWRYLMMKPLIFEMWFRLRAFWFFTLKKGFNTQERALLVSKEFKKKVVDYNQSQLWEFYRVRTEKFMVLLRCISALPNNAKVLCIGPRNEAEILLLSLYGFPLKNITGIDLFSYSPLIRCMDMHNLEFPDNSFDIVYSAWTLTYSYDLGRACSEIIRVAKPGAIVVAGLSRVYSITDIEKVPLTPIEGLNELLHPFQPNLDWMYWQEVWVENGAEEIWIIFRIRK